jgi:hypothetical protein
MEKSHTQISRKKKIPNKEWESGLRKSSRAVRKG